VCVTLKKKKHVPKKVFPEFKKDWLFGLIVFLRDAFGSYIAKEQRERESF